jgi:ATP-dependent protease HslVU (ClpYQ) peptidase subunit
MQISSIDHNTFKRGDRVIVRVDGEIRTRGIVHKANDREVVITVTTLDGYKIKMAYVPRFVFADTKTEAGADQPMRVVTQFVKEVRRDSETRDWNAYIVINDEEIYLGSRQYRFDAETLCDEYVHDQLMRQPAQKAA